MKPQPTADWEKEILYLLDTGENEALDAKPVIAFVHSLLKSQKQELITKIGKLTGNDVDAPIKDFPIQDQLSIVTGIHLGYDRVIELIKGEKE